MTRGRTLLRRLAQAVLGLSLGLLVCEGLLRAGAWALAAASARDADEVEADAWIVCHGDSNVYGLYEEAEDSYPGQLQGLIERGGNPGLRVRNMGVPGFSTRHIIESLDELPAETRCLLVTVGVNNSWSWHEGDALHQQPWYEGLRLVRLARVLTASGGGAAGPEVDDRAMFVADQEGDVGARMHNREGELVRFRGRQETLGIDAWQDSIHGDLAILKARTEERGMRLVLATYASDEGPYGLANRGLRSAARDLDLPLVDVTARTTELGERLGFAAVFHRDLHPRPTGYAVVARLVFERLVELGLVEGDPVADPFEGLEAHEELAPEARLERGDAGELTLLLEGLRPGARITVVLFGLRPRGEPFAWRSFVALEEDDEVFRLTSRDSRFTLQVGTAGTASIPLGTAFAASPDRGQLDIEVCVSELNRNGLISYSFPARTLVVP